MLIYIRVNHTTESPALLSIETVASLMTRSRSITCELISSDSSISASTSSTAQFSIISSSSVLTKFNYSFREVAIAFRRFLSLGLALTRPSASFISFVITVVFPPRLARVRDSFSTISFLVSQGIKAPRWAPTLS